MEIKDLSWIILKNILPWAKSDHKEKERIFGGTITKPTKRRAAGHGTIDVPFCTLTRGALEAANALKVGTGKLLPK